MQTNTPRRPPLGLALAVALLTLAVLAGALGFAAWQWRTLELTNPQVAAALRVLIFAVPLGLAGAAGVVGLLVAWRRYASLELLKADRIVKLTAAQQQRFPTSLTSLSFHDSSRPLPVAPTAVEPLALSAPESTVPTFAQLLDSSTIAPGRPMLLGFRAEGSQPIVGSWHDLYSVGVGGMTGSGKSWLSAFLIAQSAHSGARLIVIDPHAGDKESLATRISGLSSAYMCDAASDGKAIESALKLAADKLAGRMAGKGGSWPLVLVVDEWTSLLRGKLGDLLTATALDIAEQGRKFGVFALLAAQAWQIDAAGPVRDRLASHYTMRTRGDQFRYQMGLRGSAPLDTMFLKPGEAYFLSNRGELCKVIIPRMDAADLARIGSTLDTPRAATGLPFGFHRAGVVPSATLAPDSSGTAPGQQRDSNPAMLSSAPVSPEAARAADLFLAGKDLPAIVQELRGIDPAKGGRRYRDAAREISDLLRQAMKGI